nr:ATP-binding cassette domain-containing protein [uncultured Rhodoferax sp.]
MPSVSSESPVPTPAPVAQARALRWAPAGVPVLDLPALQIPPGVSWVGGGEGRGKSSLLRCLAGDLLLPGSHLQIGATVLATAPRAYRAQLFWMDPRTTAHDSMRSVDFLASTAARYPGWNAALLADLTEALDLTPHLEKPLYMLSTGSKRKVWLAAALASGAVLTLLDEPFAALDKRSIRCVLELLREAASHTTRAWLVADYEAPAGVPLAQHIDLGD